jgi:hypothetical protein
VLFLFAGGALHGRRCRVLCKLGLKRIHTTSHGLLLNKFVSLLYHSFCVVLLQNKRELLEKKITQAQNKKRGMWSLGSERISAADHKRGVTSKKAPVPVAARGGAQETGRSSSKANQGRGSNALESVMTGLEFVG